MFKSKYSINYNLEKDVYISKKTANNYIDEYDNPIPLYETPFFYKRINYQPLTGNDLQAYITAYGQVNGSIVRAFIDYTDDGVFKEYDLAYLYGANPVGETINGENANYQIRTYKRQNNKIMVIFEEIIKEKNNE